MPPEPKTKRAVSGSMSSDWRVTATWTSRSSSAPGAVKADSYRGCGEPIVLVGVEFSGRMRNVERIEVEAA